VRSALVSASLVGLVAAASAFGAAACNGRKHAVVAPSAEEPDAPDDDPTTDDDDGGSGDPADEPDADAPDVGDPPVDFECGDAWTKTTKSKPECEPRKVTEIDPDIAIDVNAISIARTKAGRVGVVYNAETSGEDGEMRLVSFVPKTATFTPTIQKRQLGYPNHTGNVARVVATGADTLAVLAYDLDDISESGDLVLVELVNGAPPLTDPEPVLTGVARPTEMSLAVDPSGTFYAAVRVKTGAGASAGTSVAKLAVRKKAPGGPFTALPDVAAGLVPEDAPNVGASSLFADATGQVHLLYHFCDSLSSSSPRYHSLDGATWSFRKTVDNAAGDGVAGTSPRLAVHGTTKYALFFYKKGLQSSSPTADLRLASWQLSGDTPTIEILDQAIPAPDLSFAWAPPDYRAAMAIDKYGLLHIALVRPNGPGTSYLEYLRQTKTSGGAVKWLSDIVDPDVLSDASQALVDSTVDDAARPHIAYVSGKDLKVRYATRYDR
jgi:hypothetical protein